MTDRRLAQRQAIADLLARPDGDEGKRTHKVTCEGDLDRRRLHQHLPQIFVARWQVEHDEESA